MDSTMKRGEIRFAVLDPTIGNEIRKRRPVVIVSNDANNRAAGIVTVVPLTSNVSRIYPFEVLLSAKKTGLEKDSKAVAQQIRTLSKKRLDKTPAGIVPKDLMLLINASIRLHLSLD
jgi:mRNA interferase MazF